MNFIIYYFLSVILFKNCFCMECSDVDFWNKVEDNCPDTFFRMAIKNYTRQANAFFFHMMDKKFTEEKKVTVDEPYEYKAKFTQRRKRDDDEATERYYPFADLLTELFPQNNMLGSGFHPNGNSITFPDMYNNNGNQNHYNNYPSYNGGGYNSAPAQNYPSNSYPTSNNGYPTYTNGYPTSNNGYPTSNNGYSISNNGYPTSNNGYQTSNNCCPTSNNGYPTSNNGYQTGTTGSNGHPSVNSQAVYTNKKPTATQATQAKPNKCVNLKDRIVGGTAIEIQDAPYQVLYDDRCGGAILSEDWVVTAAHCQESGNFVRAGFTNRKDAPKHAICSHHTHPQWKRSTHTFDYDFQLLLLKTPMTLSLSMMPIAIGDTRDLKPGKQVYVSGWGYVKENANQLVRQLRGVNIPLISEAECRRVPTELYQITDRMFCAGYASGGKDACQGDSGGPAVVDRKLVGLVSFGAGCARANRPGVYSKITVVKDWVTRITGIRY